MGWLRTAKYPSSLARRVPTVPDALKPLSHKAGAPHPLFLVVSICHPTLHFARSGLATPPNFLRSVPDVLSQPAKYRLPKRRVSSSTVNHSPPCTSSPLIHSVSRSFMASFSMRFPSAVKSPVSGGDARI
jgi:hypothetical protein